MRDDSDRKGASAPDPMKSDLGRTDDVPRETASATGSVAAEHARSREAGPPGRLQD